MNPLAHLLESRAEELVRRWGERIREQRSPNTTFEPELSKALPGRLRELMAALDPGPARTPRPRAPRPEPGHHRPASRKVSLVREYALLRGLVLDLIEETGHPVTLGEVRGLTDFIDAAIAEELEEHAADQRAAAELEAIFDSMADAVYVGSAAGITRANRPALEQLGYDTVEELNRNIGTLAGEIQTRRADTGEPIPTEDQAFTHALQGTADVQEVLVRHRKTGEDRVVRASCAPIRVGDRVVGAVAINTDITETRRMAVASQQRADFERQLIGIVSHDLRTPLNAITLAATALARRGEQLDEKTLKGLLRIQSSGERATRLVRDLLDFTQSRLGGTIPVERRRLDLGELAWHAVEEARATHMERDVRLEATGNALGAWDADRLTQVLTNLLTNALRYGAETSPVTVTVQGDGGAVHLAVHNRGAPIPTDQVSRLFQPFQRGTSAADPAGRGVGLGLYIVDQIVRAHGGTIVVTSSHDDGTRFTVRLPRASS